MQTNYERKAPCGRAAPVPPRRWREEACFHDKWAASVCVEDLDVLGTFAGSTDPENRYALQQLGDLRGRCLLDLGCGIGTSSTFFAVRGATVVGLDISSLMLSRASALGRRYEVQSRFQPCQAVAECLPLRSGTFDFVYGYGILHHTDLQRTLEEVRRVLRPGGRAVFIEPLGLNPVISLYRRLSPEVLTSGERPLTWRDLRAIDRVFPGAEHREVQLLSLLIHIWMALTGRIRLRTDRPWKIIVDESRTYARAFAFLQRLDGWVLRIAPALGLLSWATVLVMAKSEGGPMRGPNPAGEAKPSSGAAPPRSNRRCVVVIPAFAAATTVRSVVTAVRNALPGCEVVVVDDGSPDTTGEEARAAGATVLRHATNLGYGAALQTGYMYAVREGYTLIIQMDADGQHDPRSLATLLAPVECGEAHLVLGSRFLAKEHYEPPLARRVGMRLFCWLVRAATGMKVTDPTSGFQAMNDRVARFLSADRFPSDYADADVLILVRRAGFRVTEVPVLMHPGEHAQSMHRGLRPFYYVFRMLLAILVETIRRPSPQGRI
jgi:SAM-dependent methyltransferase